MLDDDLDKKILNALQESFPLDQRPFAAIGKTFGISEQQAMDRVQGLIDRGIIRRMGPIFNYGDMDLAGALIAAKMPQDEIEQAQAVFADLPEVTHAYQRDHEYNLWFTVIAEEQDMQRVIDHITGRLSLSSVIRLPRLNEFKLNTVFEAR